MKVISLLFVLALSVSCSTTSKCVEVDKSKCKKQYFSETVDPFQRFDYIGNRR